MARIPFLHPGTERQQPGGEYRFQPPGQLSAGGADCRGEHLADGELARPTAPLLGRTPVDWLFCRDGFWRPVGPGTFPLADAAPSRVGRLRAYGNGLDAETATQFCASVIALLAEAA